MNILVFLSNNPLALVLGLIGIGLVVAATIFSNVSKPVRQPVRVDEIRKK